MKLRLPFDSPLPDRPGARLGVLLMLGVGGLVALVVVAVFAITLLELVKG